MTKRSKRTYYVYGMTWNVEIRHAAPVSLYESVAAFKASGKCWKRDGIVKMTVDAEYVYDPVIPKKGKK